MNLSPIRRIKDPMRRAAAFQKHLTGEADKYIRTCRAERDKAVREALAELDEDGNPVHTQADVSRALGLTTSAIAQRFGSKSG